MRCSIVIALVLLSALLFLWGRHLQASVHVSNKAYDLLLSTLLSHHVPEVSVEHLQQGNVRFLDARTLREFEVSHIPGSIWIGYEEFSLDRLAGLDKHTPVAVYCAVGYRSERIVEHLLEQGYVNVTNVYGGIFEWVNTGHPVVTGQGVETNAIHAYSKFWSVWLKRGTRIYE